MYNSPEERAPHRDAAGDTETCRASPSASARDCRRATDAGRARPRVRARQSVHPLRRPHRREQGLRRAVRLLHALLRPLRSAARPGADRHAGAADSGSSAHPPPGLRQRRGQVRRDRRRRGAGDAVVVREPVDGGARGLGARACRCWPTGAATCWPASACAATAACSTRTAGSSRRCSRPCSTTRRWRANGREWTRVLRGALRMAGDRAQVPEHVRSPDARDAAAIRGAAAGLVRAAPTASTARRGGRGGSRRGPVREPVRFLESTIVKLAFITPRYGADLITGPEHACRLLAEHICHRHDVDVLTTCARDSGAWKNEYPEGPDRVRGVRIRRFPVSPSASRRPVASRPRGCWPSRTPAPTSSTG